MVNRVFTGNSIPDIGYMMKASAGGKVSLPVAPASLVYSHLKHVSGVPAPEGSEGVTISKLNMLDVLIDQMNQMKKPVNPAPELPSSGSKQDAIIEAYRMQVVEAKAARASMPYIPAPAAQTGVLFSLIV